MDLLPLTIWLGLILFSCRMLIPTIWEIRSRSPRCRAQQLSLLRRGLIANGLKQEQFRRAGIGDQFVLKGITFKIGPSAHDNTLATGADGGPAASFFITFMFVPELKKSVRVLASGYPITWRTRAMN